MRHTKLLRTTALGTLLALAAIAFPNSAALAAPVITLEKTSSATSVNAGTMFTYSITARNNGDTTAQNVVIRDTLDGNLDFVSSTPATTTNAMTTSGETALTWNVGSLAVGQSSTVTVTVDTPDLISVTNVIPNTATVTGDNFPTATSSTVSVSVVQPNPVISVRKVPTATHVGANDVFTYNITVSNIGGSTATGVSVSDTIDPNTTLVSVSPAATTSTSGGSTTTWTVGDLTPQQSVSFTVQVRVNGSVTVGTAIDNVVRVTGNNFTAVDAPSFSSVLVGAPTPTPTISATPTATPILGGVGGGLDPDDLPRTGVAVGFLVATFAACALCKRLIPALRS